MCVEDSMELQDILQWNIMTKTRINGLFLTQPVLEEKALVWCLLAIVCTASVFILYLKIFRTQTYNLWILKLKGVMMDTIC